MARTYRTICVLPGNPDNRSQGVFYNINVGVMGMLRVR